ncbi:hypothetical protein H5410_032287 [Solanum commersonii]|uniref:Uncharacterized protein n=1 Tax=Solanum commersonii TaxID=4109 RepID=A0A9J5YLR3_SOLCO|nr:hypothetical protein H5410_032287 [Solanum commersonii]
MSPLEVNISKKLSQLLTLTHQPHNASTHVAPQSGYTISTPTAEKSGRPVAVPEMFKVTYQEEYEPHVHHPQADGGDRETISAMESKIAYLNAELAVRSRKKERRKREKREGRLAKERR